MPDGQQGIVAPAPAMWGEPLPPHSLENVGVSPIHIISTELKIVTSRRPRDL